MSFDVCRLMLVLLGKQNWNTCAENYIQDGGHKSMKGSVHT